MSLETCSPEEHGAYSFRRRYGQRLLVLQADRGQNPIAGWLRARSAAYSGNKSEFDVEGVLVGGSRRSKWSLASQRSILSIGSTDSILSIGSAGSILSIGSVASFASIGSIGSAMSALSFLSHQSRLSALSYQSACAILSVQSKWTFRGYQRQGP
jgi:hypothetical protein